MPIEQWQLINNQIHALKQSYFDDPSVEIKSSWLRFPPSRKKRYLVPYDISEEGLDEFVGRIYVEILDRQGITLLAAVIDKVQMSRIYKTPQNSSSLAYRLLFERFQRFLESRNDYGMVIFDKITDAPSQTAGYENLLTRQHLRYLMQGTEFVKIDNIVEGLLFIPSEENNFIQLADLCAYNVFRQFKEQGDKWDKPATIDAWPLYRYFKDNTSILRRPWSCIERLGNQEVS